LSRPRPSDRAKKVVRDPHPPHKGYFIKTRYGHMAPRVTCMHYAPMVDQAKIKINPFFFSSLNIVIANHDYVPRGSYILYNIYIQTRSEILILMEACNVCVV